MISGRLSRRTGRIYTLPSEAQCDSASPRTLPLTLHVGS